MSDFTLVPFEAANDSVWFSDPISTEGTLTFDLGTVSTIQGLAIWNLSPSFSNALNEFELFADNDNIFTNGTRKQLITANAQQASLLTMNPFGATNAEAFSFAATPTRYIHLNILSNHQSESNF